MAEARMIEMMARAIATKRIWQDVEPYDDGTVSSAYVWKQVERMMPEARDEARAALSVLARPENIPTECVMVALREMRDQSPFSTDEWKDAIAKVFAAAAGDEDRRAS